MNATKRIRICIYGGTDLQGAPPEFISCLSYEILNSMPAVIITGGFRYSNKKPQAVSTDVAALTGAMKYAKEQEADLKQCYEAWVPEHRLDSRPDVGGVVRLNEQDGVTVRIMAGRTPLGRRLATVAGVDMAVTISGRQHTEVVVEQALEIGVPVLPIPNAGGDSKDLMDTYQERIMSAFDPETFKWCLEEVSRTNWGQPAEAAKAVVTLLRTAKIGKCLVLLPYDESHDKLYDETIAPAIGKHMLPVRLDRLPKSEAIYASFADAVESASALIADITSLNQNVMYEIGYAHGRTLTPLIYTREAARREQLPVYFRTLNVRLASETTLGGLIDEYLRSLRIARNLHQIEG